MLRDARKTVSPGQRLLLHAGQVGAALLGEVEQGVELGAVEGAPSAVPCTSTNFPSPVITTFMSVSARTSST